MSVYHITPEGTEGERLQLALVSGATATVEVDKRALRPLVDRWQQEDQDGNKSGMVNQVEKTTNPGVGDDIDDGYIRSSIWINTNESPPRAWMCTDNSAGAAVWEELGTVTIINDSITGFVSGARATYNTGTTIDIGEVSKKTVVATLDGSSSTSFIGVLTADITTSGAGGLDTGSPADDNWYAVHVIWDTNEVNATDLLLSLSDTAPTMPAGYDKFRRVWWTYRTSGSVFRQFFQIDAGVDKACLWDVERGQLSVLIGGNDTTYTDIPLDDFVPPSSQEAFLQIDYTPQNVNNIFQVRQNGSSISESIFRVQSGVANKTVAVFNSFFCDDNQIVEYKVSLVGDDADVYVGGYIDNLI